MTQDNTRQLGDSFAVALLQWPALIGAIELDGPGWALAARIVLGTWAALVALSLIFGRREGPRWGVSMALAAACAAALWLTVPTLWALVWFGALLLSFHTAIRARFDEAEPGPAPEPAPSRA